ncbi:MAG: GNAT family N-acetyltransferase [Dehalococcoidia bacterium]
MTTTPEPDVHPVLNLVGETVALGPQRRDLVPLYRRWLNDFVILTGLGVPPAPLTHEAEEQQYRDTDAAADQVWFTVYERTTLRPLGISGLRDIDHAHGTAEFVIFIGERELWRRGYGTEATRLVLDYGFTALGLHSILLRVYDFNVRGIQAYTRAGFREVGRWRQAHRLAGRVVDVVFMDCLASEFESLVLQRLLVDAGEGADHP